MEPAPGGQSALAGVKVLDVSTVLAAPVTATMLGDFGADVVKVEAPGVGDFTRRGAQTPGGRSLEWVQEARNKRSITLDLHHERGRQILHELVGHFDVLVTNYRPPTLQAWDLDPDTIKRKHPELIALYVTGYGLTGPYRDRGAFDRVASAFAGLTYVSGYPDGPPVRTGYAVIDYMTAYLGAFSVVTALYHRDHRHGGGQIIDLALYEAGFRASEGALLRFAANGVVRERVGNRSPDVVPASDFVTADGRRLTIHAGTESLFARLSGVMGQPELVGDPRFSTHGARVANQDKLYAVIAEWVAMYQSGDLIDMFGAAGIPAAPVMNIADIAADVHYLDRGTIMPWNDEEHGELLMVSPIPRMSATPGAVRSAGPPLGAHNAEVYASILGLSQRQIADLQEQGIV
jgi:crotonobetainyl-CoA:carnitine CoA-transferase CaiB-like acyl-CoA transferase